MDALYAELQNHHLLLLEKELHWSEFTVNLLRVKVRLDEKMRPLVDASSPFDKENCVP